MYDAILILRVWRACGGVFEELGLFEGVWRGFEGVWRDN
jgi:hypothetical protein